MKDTRTNPNDNVTAYVNDNGVSYSGLTKREYFAAMAMQSLIPNKVKPSEFMETFDNVAHQSVMYADALIKALNK